MNSMFSPTLNTIKKVTQVSRHLIWYKMQIKLILISFFNSENGWNWMMAAIKITKLSSGMNKTFIFFQKLKLKKANVAVQNIF